MLVVLEGVSGISGVRLPVPIETTKSLPVSHPYVKCGSQKAGSRQRHPVVGTNHLTLHWGGARRVYS